MSKESENYVAPNMLPIEIVKYLDRYIIGQSEAKKTISVALRNRYRRSKLSQELQDEIVPSNIIMMGPTGVGKTEIVRRISKVLGAPYVKVEATKFTEVGYVGRDVESVVRDLVEASIRLVRSNKANALREEARELANERLIDILIPNNKKISRQNPFNFFFKDLENNIKIDETEEEISKINDKKQIYREKLRRCELEDEKVDIEISEKNNTNDFLSQMGMDYMVNNMNDMIKNMLPQKIKKKKVKISEARDILTEQIIEELIDHDKLANEAITLAENHGIIFIDEIDKIAENEKSHHRGGISREGVQRDILPIVEGSVVKTKYGQVKTDHILFVAAGAFHISKVEDLIPELQGRFPIIVKLDSLTEDDFIKILIETDFSLIEQYKKMLSMDHCYIDFQKEGIIEIAKIAHQMNEEIEDLGARRLMTVMEILLRDLLFEAGKDTINLVIDDKYVSSKLSKYTKSNDYMKYLL